MIKIKRLEIAGLIGATKALRLPYSKDARSEGKFEYESAKLSEGTDVHTETTMYVADDDVNLMRTLKKRGDVHAKVLRGIMVWVEITAPRYFWQEFDVYRIGVEKLSSESTMHTIGKGGLTPDNFSFDKEDATVYDYINRTCDTINKMALDYAVNGNYDYVRKIKTILPESFMQKRVVMMSYQALRRIVEQRHDHRLYEWREFCGWVATLPFAEELITGDLCRKDK